VADAEAEGFGVGAPVGLGVGSGVARGVPRGTVLLVSPLDGFGLGEGVVSSLSGLGVLFFFRGVAAGVPFRGVESSLSLLSAADFFSFAFVTSPSSGAAMKETLTAMARS